MISMRRTLIAALLLVLVTACTPPPPASSATTAPPSASSAPASTPTASPSPTVAATPIVLPSFVQLSAPSGTVVWALVAGNRLFRSTDSGETWQERPATFDIFDSEAAFVSDAEGWLARPGPAATQCIFQSVRVTHTADAGATWEQLIVATPPSAADPGGGLANAQCKSGLGFADSRRGFLSASDPNSRPRIFRTTDGGRTWSPSQPLPDPPGFTTRAAGLTLRPDRVHPFGATLLVRASGTVDGKLVSYVFRSVDGGATWTYVATLPETAGVFSFVSATRWLQIAPPGSSKETTDGGATWRAFTTDYSQAAGVAPQIVFGDTLVGYATVRGAIQRTVDGGAHWMTIKTPGT